ncbi:hypothetical protein GCM10010912_40440 [Paenibacillus albidus]|uniref:Uncharacterized protein n=1 Tax=Paenibacillus albidus TaxID=2041023 RepID=A0A917CK42_9BACL|nr:hypothetical protein [Paenibacillus albidus]GGF91334.1 hypothetical protein GCM10010912_40440 [Paenibacillus albidus]
MSNLDNDNKTLEKPKTVFETTEVISAKVYKVNPEQKEKLDRLAEERLEQTRKEAIPKIRERYEQLIKERRQLQQPKADGEGRTPQ